MPKVAIITDAMTSLPKELIRLYRIHEIPTYILLGGHVFRDRADLDTGLFYQWLRISREPPITWQPTTSDFLRVYRHLMQDAEAIISIHSSGELNAVVHSARAARDALEAECRVKGNSSTPIYIFDSRSIAMATGFAVLAAARAVAQGQSLSTILHLVEALIPRVKLIFLVDAPEYLYRSGWAGEVATLLGTELSIRTIMYSRDGRMRMLKKVRARRKAITYLLETMAAWMDSSNPIRAAILHAGAPDDAMALKEEIKASFTCLELCVYDLRPALASYLGPDALLLTWYTYDANKH